MTIDELIEYLQKIPPEERKTIKVMRSDGQGYHALYDRQIEQCWFHQGRGGFRRSSIGYPPTEPHFKGIVIG